MGTSNILELQNNGYKSTVSAIAEIIDNSIQASANNIDIVIIRSTTRDQNEIEEILLIDDGVGMDEDTFSKALQISAGTRSKAKSGLGKYGMGLPNSSISQTKRVEVYSIQNNKKLFNYFDLDEIFESGEAFLPEIEEVVKVQIPIFESKKLKVSENGTIVRWVRPNKVIPKTAKTLSEHIEKIGGKIFRHLLNGFIDTDNKEFKVNINILVYDYNGETFELNGNLTRMKIKPFDPMFLMTNTQMSDQFSESIHPTSVLYPNECKKTFEIEYNNEKIKTTVEIKLSYCKKEERNRYGSLAGSTEFGKMYHRRNMINGARSGYQNISIIRAGREIDCGDFGFINSVNETDRWWSAEIIVTPEIDSIIGVDNKKQQASNIKYINKEWEDDGDAHEILRFISTYLFENIKTVRKEINQQNTTVISPGKGKEKPEGWDHEKGDNPKGADSDNDNDAQIEIRKDMFDWISERYPNLSDIENKRIIDYALGLRDHHIFIKSDLGESNLYSYKVFGTKVLIELNYEHSFYKNFVTQFESDVNNEKSLRSIRLLIGSMVNSEILNSSDDKNVLKYRRDFKFRLSTSLDDYISDLYGS